MEYIPFGKYCLLARLGKGGMAEVFKALLVGAEGFEKVVALKVMHTELGADERQQQALIDEARLCGLLDHPNVVRVHEFGKEAGRYYLSMEYVDGWSLARLIKHCRECRQWMPESVAVEIFLRICRGMQYAHSKANRKGQPLSIVHRDLKPDNIMVGRNGEVKVMDFGIARATSQSHQTKTGLTRGTPTCMSPEQVTGDKNLDHRSDIFAMGIMLTEMLTLRLMFAGDDVLALLHAILGVKRDAQAQQSLQRRHPHLLPVIDRCLEREAHQRWSSVNALVEALLAATSGTKGPSLTEWLEQVAPSLPGSIADGDWGVEGPPNIPQPVETLSHTALQPLATNDDVVSRLQSRPSAAIAPVMRSGELVWEEVPEHEMPPLPEPVPAPMRRTNPQRKKRKALWPMWLAVGAAFAAVALIVGVLVQDSDPQPQPVVNTTTAPPDVVVELPGLSVKPTFERPTPTPMVRRQPTPAPVQRDTTPTPTPANATEPTPEPPQALALGTVSFNSVPWAHVTIRRTDGSSVSLKGGSEGAATPVKNIELPVGEYSVSFRCGDASLCEGKSATVPFRVQEGPNSTVMNRFK